MYSSALPCETVDYAYLWSLMNLVARARDTRLIIHHRRPDTNLNITPRASVLNITSAWRNVSATDCGVRVAYRPLLTKGVGTRFAFVAMVIEQKRKTEIARLPRSPTIHVDNRTDAGGILSWRMVDAASFRTSLVWFYHNKVIGVGTDTWMMMSQKIVLDLVNNNR